ncbi:MAG TPA: hypothetical protein VNG93_07245 [Candidatus Dormibacteraeota bacterium]|nr:hypothetical protein [Candidatus Dormibacteraeota bacterium]
MPLLGGLFGGRAEIGPVVIPVPPSVPVAFRVYYVPGYPPMLPGDLRAAAATWSAAHVEEPLRSALTPLFASPELTYTDMAKTAFPPPLEVIKGAGAGEEEKARLDAAWQVAVVACPARLEVPVFGLWAAMAAGRSAALELNGALFDAAALRLTPIASYSDSIAGRGTVAVGDHVTSSSATDGRGLVRWTTIGMVKFGLPEIEIQDAPGLIDLGPLLVALGQRLLDLLLTANHGRPQPITELVLEPVVKLALGGRPAHVRVYFTPGTANLPGLLDVLPTPEFAGTQGDFLVSLF